MIDLHLKYQNINWTSFWLARLSSDKFHNLPYRVLHFYQTAQIDIEKGEHYELKEISVLMVSTNLNFKIEKNSSKQNQIFHTTGLFPEAISRRCSVKKVFLKISQIHRKTPVPSLFFNKEKKDSGSGVSCEFAKFLRTSFFIEHLRRLLLSFYIHWIHQVCWCFQRV